MCFLNLGNAIIVTSDLRGALEAYQSSLQIFRDAGDSHGQGTVMAAIGMALVTSGEGERGRSVLKEAQRLLEPFHEPDRKRLIAELLQSPE
jgi:hypothetical protein